VSAPAAPERPAGTQAVLDRYAAVHALLARAMAAGAGEAAATARALPVMELEARRLDARAFDAWRGMFAEDACLWIPAHPEDHPARDQALAFDDPRRMAERAWRMHDRKAWALVSPPPATVRALGPVAAWEEPDGLLATAALTVTHVRRGPALTLHGREVLRLTEEDAGLLIADKILIFPELTLGRPHLGWLM
jgi:3-phenylpropionate/cinnamic acid dioxygenase small subunit